MNETQQNIYKGLTQLSPEIGAFYKDALMIMGNDCGLSTKVNLVAHLSREIDGGFRDIFAPKTPESKKESEKTKEGHKESIVKALGFENSNISKEWFSVANTFNKFAHRHGFTPRTFDEFKQIWDRYEKVLNILSGSAYAITDRIAHIVSFEAPTEHILGSLKQVMKDPVHRFQFFNSLKKIAWLEPLFNSGVFDPTTFPNPQNHEEWFQLRYLDNIAASATVKEAKIIIEIIRNLQIAVMEGKSEIDDYSMSYLLSTLAKLPNYIISVNDIEFLTFLNNKWAYSHKFFESNITEGFLKAYIASSSKEGIIALLPYCFSFSKNEIKVEGFEELGITQQQRVIPNLSEPYLSVINQHISEIITIGGIDLLEKLTIKLNELYLARPYELIDIPSIEPSEQSGFYSGNWEFSLVEFLTKSGEELSAEELPKFVSLLLDQDSPIHSRIVIHLIRQRYDVLSSLFWKWIQSKKLDVLFPIHELYLLIKERFKNLSEEEFETFTKWIESIEFEAEHLSEIEIKESINLRIRKYLDALKPEKENQQKLLGTILAKYQDENSYNFEHPEFDGYSTAGYAYDFPDGVADLEGKSVEEQLTYLAGFTIPDHFNNIPMGLGSLMNNYIINNPEKYISKLEEMGKLPLVYLDQFISSFGHVMKNGALTDWEKPLEMFTTWIIESQKSGKMDIYNLASFLLLLSESNDTYKFSEENLNTLITKTINLLSFDGYKTLDHLDTDYAGFMLNDGNAKLFDALVNFSRLWAKLQPEDSKILLHPEVKAYIELNLPRTSEKDKVFSIGLGIHFPFFHYADSDWCVSNVDKIFPQKNQLHFLYTITGLFSNRYPPYKSIIKYMHDNGINNPSVGHFIKDSAELNRLCRLALVEYFYIDPSVINNNQSLLSLIIVKGHPGQFEKLVNVCINLERGAQLPIKELWQRIFDRCIQEPDKIKGTINNLVLLSDNFSELNEEEIKLIESCLPYLDNGRPTYILIRNLLRLSEKNPEKATEILMKIWKQTGIQPYVNDELKQFISTLYLKGMESLADEVCLYVSSLGNLGLKPIYDNYHLDRFTS